MLKSSYQQCQSVVSSHSLALSLTHSRYHAGESCHVQAPQLSSLAGQQGLCVLDGATDRRRLCISWQHVMPLRCSVHVCHAGKPRTVVPQPLLCRAAALLSTAVHQ